MLSRTQVSVFIFPIGTVVQTSYFYYDDTDGNLVFRTSTNVIDIDAFGNVFMDTIRLYEALDRSTLSVNDSSLASNNMRLFPNPVSSNLNVKLSDNSFITSTQILDLNGRTVMTIEDNRNPINVSNLQAGLYIIAIETSTGFYTKRFIKK